MSCILVTGAGGFLGTAVARLAHANGHDVISVTRQDIDLNHEDAVADFLERFPC